MLSFLHSKYILNKKEYERRKKILLFAVSLFLHFFVFNIYQKQLTERIADEVKKNITPNKIFGFIWLSNNSSTIILYSVV